MAVVVFLFGVLGLGQQAADAIQAFIFGQVTAGVASTDLADAIECSYVRCSQGCAAAAAAAITVHFPTGNFNCMTHCKSAIDSYNAANPNNKITDGRLCGEAAKEHPLIVKVSDKNMYISTDDLKFEEVCKGKKCCIFPSDDNKIQQGNIAAVIKNSFIKKVEITEGNCLSTQGVNFPTSFCNDGALYCPARTVTLNPGTYYVWTEKYGFIIGSSMQNIVWDSYTTPITGSNFVCCSGAWQTGTDCATGTKQDATECDPAASAGVDACASKCTLERYSQSYYGTERNEGDYEICHCVCMAEAAPSITFSAAPSQQTTAAGHKITYKISITNTLDDEIPLKLSVACPAGWTCEHPNGISVGAGKSASIYLNVTSAAVAPVGTYTIRFTAETLSSCPSYATSVEYQVSSHELQCSDYAYCPNCLAESGTCKWCDGVLSDWCAASSASCGLGTIERTTCTV